MEQRSYDGRIDARELAQALLDEWDQGETIAQALEADEGYIVQIGQRDGGWFGDEPRNALTLSLEPRAGGLQVTMGQQQWYKQGGQVVVGGLIGIIPFFFTWPPSGLFRGPDEPIDSALPAQIWASVERYTGRQGAATGPTRRLATVPCPNCGVANPQDAARCSACGAGLAPATCSRCGSANPPGANFCVSCGNQLRPLGRSVGDG
jgi:predicted RNA-binding Zn-ribbon protein involved in translation (DUF1610 family)